MEFENGLVREALFADESPEFRFPNEAMAGDEVIFRFRTLKDNVDAVYMMGRGFRQPMEKAFRKGMFDYYETAMTVGSDVFRYCFEVVRQGEELVYTRRGVEYLNSAQEQAFFQLIPNFQTPDWAKGAVYYQIFTDRFRNGNPESDVLTGEYYYINRQVEGVEDWEAPVTSPDVHRFYGGDLQGVIEKLDYLKYLGVEVIYFNPLFVSPSNHKYDIQDYDHIDPHFTGFVHDEGALLPPRETDNTKAERYITRVTDPENLEHADEVFATLVEEAHKRGIRIVIDGVFNHCGSFNRWMDRTGIYEKAGAKEPGAYGHPESPYRDRFIFTGNSNEYIGWWRHETLPKLNYEHSGSLNADIQRIAAKWLSYPFYADGWRLDVAADLGLSDRFNHRFWQQFRKTVKEENPDALILAEHYGDPSPWLNGSEWDAVMNYDAFMDPVSYFLTGMEKHSDNYNAFLHGNGQAFLNNLTAAMHRLPIQALLASMNQLSNHDHSRFLTRTNSRVGRLETAGTAAASEGIDYALFRIGVMMQFTIPGAPALYYGDEAGLTGWTDPDNRRPFPWGHENWDLVSFHKEIIRIYKSTSSLRFGSFIPLVGEDGLVAYGRFDENNAAVVIINQSRSPRETEVPVWKLGIPEDAKVTRVMGTIQSGYNIGRLELPVEDGMLRLTLREECALLYVYRF